VGSVVVSMELVVRGGPRCCRCLVLKEAWYEFG